MTTTKKKKKEQTNERTSDSTEQKAQGNGRMCFWIPAQNRTQINVNLTP